MRPSPPIISRIICDLYDRGLTRRQIAIRIGIRPAVVSQIKNASGYLADDKVAILADLHGAYTARELILLKHLERIDANTGIGITETMTILKSLKKRKKLTP